MFLRLAVFVALVRGMARLPRIVVPGVPYHITHRGNLRADVFFTDADRLAYLKLLQTYSAKYELEIWAYCLMTNHVHLLAVARRLDSMAKAIGLAHQRYSAFINAQNAHTGHLWANRYFSTPLDEPHLWQAVRYVELNPVRARMTNQAQDYQWSSARAHCGDCEPGVLHASRPFPGRILDWSAYLGAGLSIEVEKRIRTNTYSGRATGDEAFIKSLETATGRILQPQRAGPKPKQTHDLTDDLFT